MRLGINLPFSVHFQPLKYYRLNIYIYMMDREYAETYEPTQNLVDWFKSRVGNCVSVNNLPIYFLSHFGDIDMTVDFISFLF